MYPINVNAADANSLAAFFGCQLGSMPFTYLGLPVGTTRPKFFDLLPLIDCMERRLRASSWFLPQGSRLQPGADPEKILKGGKYMDIFLNIDMFVYSSCGNQN